MGRNMMQKLGLLKHWSRMLFGRYRLALQSTCQESLHKSIGKKVNVAPEVLEKGIRTAFESSLIDEVKLNLK